MTKKQARIILKNVWVHTSPALFLVCTLSPFAKMQRHMVSISDDAAGPTKQRQWDIPSKTAQSLDKVL